MRERSKTDTGESHTKNTKKREREDRERKRLMQKQIHDITTG